MAKLEQCIKVVALLQQGSLSQKELSEHLKVSTRQVSNIIDDLKKNGFNIKSKTGVLGGYYLGKGSCPVCKKEIKK